jgi:tetratricopeptide (TPR) repeat protein
MGYGFFCYAHGDIHERINFVTEDISASPNDAMLYIKRAALYLDDGDYGNTILDIEYVEKLEGPEFAPSFLVLAKMCYKMETFDAALKHIDDFLLLEPDHVLGLLTKAKILVAQEKNDLAADYYKLAIDKTTTLLPQNFIDLIDAFRNAGQLDQAFQYYEIAQMKFGNLLVLDLMAIEISEIRSDFSTIHKILDEIISGQERKEKWHFMKAEYFEKEGNLTKAFEELSLANESLLKLPYRLRIVPAMQELNANIAEKKIFIATKIEEQNNE